jgi:hypothetical protein
MRAIQEPGFAPLSKEDAKELLEVGIPYRLSLLREGFWPRWSGEHTEHTSPAFEAGAVSGRILLSFLGLKCAKRSGELEPDTKHDSVDKNTTDDVKAPDLGGSFAEIERLSHADREALAVFVRG